MHIFKKQLVSASQVNTDVQQNYSSIGDDAKPSSVLASTKQQSLVVTKREFEVQSNSLPAVERSTKRNALNNASQSKQRILQISQSVLNKGSKEAEISNILKNIAPTQVPSYLRQFERRTSEATRLVLNDSAQLPLDLKNQQARRSRIGLEANQALTQGQSDNYNDGELRAINFAKEKYRHNPDKSLEGKLVVSRASHQTQLYYKQPNIPKIQPLPKDSRIPTQVTSLRDSVEMMRNQISNGQSLEKLAPFKATQAHNQAYHIIPKNKTAELKSNEVYMLQQSSSAQLMSERSPKFFLEFEQEKVDSSPYVKQSMLKIKMKPKFFQYSSANRANRGESRDSLERSQKQKAPMILHLNQAWQHADNATETPYETTKNLASNLPQIGRHDNSAYQQSRQGTVARSTEPLSIEEVVVKRSQQKESNSFNRAFKISQLNALTNKRIKQKLETLVIEQALTQPVMVFVKPPKKKDTSASVSHQESKRRLSQNHSLPDLSPSRVVSRVHSQDENDLVTVSDDQSDNC